MCSEENSITPGLATDFEASGQSQTTEFDPKATDIQLRLKYQILFGLYAALVFLAYIQPLDMTVFEPDQNGNRAPVWVQGAYFSAWIAPAMPLFFAGYSLMGMRQIPVGYVRFFALFSLAFGLLLTFTGLMFSLGSDTEILHGVTLTIAVASSVLIWSGSVEKPPPSRVAKTGIFVGTLAALWSLLTVPMILVQSHIIADGSPYCIANHSSNAPIEALHELRGFTFYTNATGYKSTSGWYFHGLMIVDLPSEQRVYNWSPGRWRFDQVEQPDILIAPVRNACTPS